eukprot:Skav215724  [mRNA]  locus=scaffold2573:724221:728776:- [translate_table: standard]
MTTTAPKRHSMSSSKSVHSAASSFTMDETGVTWFFFDVSLVVLDFVLLLGMVPDAFKSLTLLRLFRFAKFKQAMMVLETLLEARGMIRAKHILTILQCVIFILVVNHVLACVTVYVGRREQTFQRINWIDVNQVIILTCLPMLGAQIGDLADEATTIHEE